MTTFKISKSGTKPRKPLNFDWLESSFILVAAVFDAQAVFGRIKNVNNKFAGIFFCLNLLKIKFDVESDLLSFWLVGRLI